MAQIELIDVAPKILFPSAVVLLGMALAFWFVYISEDRVAKKFGTPTKQKFLKAMTLVLWGATSFLADATELSSIFSGKVGAIFPTYGPVLIFVLGCAVICTWLTWHKDTTETKAKEELERCIRRERSEYVRTKQIGKLLGAKATRVHKGCPTDGTKPTVPRLREVLDPQAQFALNFACLHSCLQDNVGKSTRLRLILFLPKTDDPPRMACTFSYDGEKFDREGASILRQGDRFHIDSVKKCLTLYAAKRAGLHIVRDSLNLTEEEAEKFELFYDTQSDHLRSIFAFGYDGWNEAIRPVLVAYADEANLFGESEYPKEEMMKDLTAFSERLFFELDMSRLLQESS